jgi:hypothetical protein
MTKVRNEFMKHLEVGIFQLGRAKNGKSLKAVLL